MATHTLPPLPGDAPLERVLEFPDNRLLIELCGEFDRNLAQIEHLMDVQIVRRGNAIAIHGGAQDMAAEALGVLYDRAEAGRSLDPGDIDAVVRLGASDAETGARSGDQIEMFQTGDLEIKTQEDGGTAHQGAAGLCPGALWS